MRVLIVPELYRPTEATATGTVNDAVAWVDEWLRRDPSIHVYWLLPPRERANYDAAYVRADRERVTLIEAESFLAGHDYEYAFTETGYTEAQLLALKEAIYDRLGYVDVVVDQLRRGRADLYKWLLLLSGRRNGTVEPFSIIANVHDLLLPFKYRRSGHRNEYQRRTEESDAALSDGIWFKAGVDRDGMDEHARTFLRDEVVEAALDDAVLTQSPIHFSRFEERYRERPAVFHVAGSIWRKKNTERVMAVAARLHEEVGIRTVITSMGDIPAEYADLAWVDARPNASRETYERALREGDLAVCASEYETMARTPFEQAASGQVVVFRDEPWIYDCVPRDYRFVGAADELAALAVEAVRDWEGAVAENRRLVDYARSVRDPEVSGRRTHEDMERHVARRLDAYDPPAEHELVLDLAADADRVALDELLERSRAVTPDGRPVTESATYSLGELVFSLRLAGYRDVGNPGTPVFERAADDRDGR